MKHRLLLVDGHSVIFRWEELTILHARKSELGRAQLVRMLRDFQDATEYQVAVVFDGRGVRVSQSNVEGEIQIFYSKSGQSADAIIERLTAKYAKEHDITVVTDDNLERQTVTSFGGHWMSTDQFKVEMLQANRDLAERIEKLNKRRK